MIFYPLSGGNSSIFLATFVAIGTMEKDAIMSSAAVHRRPLMILAPNMVTSENIVLFVPVTVQSSLLSIEQINKTDKFESHGEMKDKAARLTYFLLLTGSAFHIAKVPQMVLCFKQTVNMLHLKVLSSHNSMNQEEC